MKVVIRNLSLAGSFIGFVCVAQGAEIQGVLMDKMCSAMAVKDPAFAAKHDRACAMAAACTKSGYGVFTTDNKDLTFDEAGNQTALAALKASKKAGHLQGAMEGVVDADMTNVAS